MKKETPKGNPADLFYYLVLFKTEGHTTWRGALQGKKDGFDKDWASQTNTPKITDRKEFIIDRITGKIKELKT